VEEKIRDPTSGLFPLDFLTDCFILLAMQPASDFSHLTLESDCLCDCGREDHLPNSVFGPACLAAVQKNNDKIKTRDLLAGMKLVQKKAIP